ncbi:MAG TPA: DUF2306 domain-containing protein [Caulobacteraceae bacterium]|jgi:uncharacterized membrane protein|nr:DUF2306 domain-containing protein [Caulobacteraceae bacterium]
MASVAEGRGGRAGWPLALVFAGAVAVGLVSYRYLLPGAPGAAPPILANSFARYGFLTIHAGFAATALILGPFQFLRRVRLTRPALHRWTGRTYVVCCLAGGAAGLVLAFGARTGPVSTAGFGSLAVLWVTATSLAWRAALVRRFAEHRRWMIRSYAMTFAAVTLRIYLPFAFLSPWGYDNAYRAISFLAWVPNVIVAELYLRRRPLP